MGKREFLIKKPPGALNTVTTEKLIDKVLRIVIDNRRLTMIEIAEAVDISPEHVHAILHDCEG